MSVARMLLVLRVVKLIMIVVWNDLRHMLTTDEKLKFCFEEFDCHEKPMIEFELILLHNDIEFVVCLLPWREENNAEHVSTPVENVEHHDKEPVEDAATDESDESAVDNNYEVDEELEDDSDVSLVEEIREKDYGNSNRCDP
ncbi:hypothetical protein Dsin_024869 [Dipteronia sinensis]|uniref:Uncharacterized protein n=1 Tax=Dipteronia sinensis TaxID=43782 RepID=A0AAD9ZVW4_9ROSI|nr:hypothetical protein Dsin_024869 [Dipteronia sinensis]